MFKLHSQIVGDGPDLVLLHGWGLHSEIWLNLVDDLRQQFRLHLIDLPGCGKSNKVTEYPQTIEHLAEIVLEHTPNHAIWIGWSLGGLIASYIASHSPQRVKQLVTITSTPKFIAEEASDWPGLSSEALTQFALNLTQNYQQTLFRFFSLQWYGIPNAKTWLKKLEPFFIKQKPAMEALQQQLTILQKTDLREALKQIQCPVLHVLGRLDAIVPESLSAKLKELVPQHQIHVIPKAAHLPFLTHQEQFLPTLISFLKNNL